MPVRSRMWAALAATVVLAAAGCGKNNPSSPGTGGGGSMSDFSALVQTTYPSGAVLPTTLESDATLLVTMDVGGFPAAGALFQSGTHFVDAGRVLAWADSPLTPLLTVDSLARLSVTVSSRAEYVYSSIPNLPALPRLAFDGVLQHHFRVAGSASFAAFEDSVQSVARPAVSAPAASANVPRSGALAVTWSDAGTDTTVYVLCAVRADADTGRFAIGDLVRDVAGAASIPSARLSTLQAGSARLSVARYRLLRRLNGSLHVNLVSEGTTLRAVTLQ